eukprot:TRINITY_DN12098_c0_g1_i1.p1 TRINITY_DN12098_c0_g1~~TRINITY_DN12098_c0_g1_i1.p1  ORF type:complete len:417 (+),score=61.39 TRINITY_DN12098_c0_g1_i1:44-1294(+)
MLFLLSLLIFHVEALRLGDSENASSTSLTDGGHFSCPPGGDFQDPVTGEGHCCYCRQSSIKSSKTHSCRNPKKKVTAEEVPWTSMALPVRGQNGVSHYRRPVQWTKGLCCVWEPPDSVKNGDEDWNNAKCYGFSELEIGAGTACMVGPNGEHLMKQKGLDRMKEIWKNGVSTLTEKANKINLENIKAHMTVRNMWKAVKIIGGMALVITAIACMAGPQAVACLAAAGTAGAIWAIGKAIIDAGFQYTEKDADGNRVNSNRSVVARLVFGITVGGVLGLVGVPNTIFAGLDSQLGDAADLAWEAYDVAFNQACNAVREASDGRADMSSAAFNLDDLPPTIRARVEEEIKLQKGPGFFEAAGEEAGKQVTCGLMQSLSGLKKMWKKGAKPRAVGAFIRKDQVPYPEIQESCDFPHGDH